MSAQVDLTVQKLCKKLVPEARQSGPGVQAGGLQGIRTGLEKRTTAQRHPGQQAAIVLAGWLAGEAWPEPCTVCL